MSWLIIWPPTPGSDHNTLLYLLVILPLTNIITLRKNQRNPENQTENTIEMGGILSTVTHSDVGPMAGRPTADDHERESDYKSHEESLEIQTFTTPADLCADHLPHLSSLVFFIRNPLSQMVEEWNETVRRMEDVLYFSKSSLL